MEGSGHADGDGCCLTALCLRRFEPTGPWRTRLSQSPTAARALRSGKAGSDEVSVANPAGGDRSLRTLLGGV
ncbi:MAG: hypothetical protein PHW86_05085 [Candidatus Bipolaricaulis sp.]|nr:hypothetical protein [Candidatus Bipolaricaulis sp.]